MNRDAVRGRTQYEPDLTYSNTEPQERGSSSYRRAPIPNNKYFCPRSLAAHTEILHNSPGCVNCWATAVQTAFSGSVFWCRGGSRVPGWACTTPHYRRISVSFLHQVIVILQWEVLVQSVRAFVRSRQTGHSWHHSLSCTHARQLGLRTFALAVGSHWVHQNLSIVSRADCDSSLDRGRPWIRPPCSEVRRFTLHQNSTRLLDIQAPKYSVQMSE